MAQASARSEIKRALQDRQRQWLHEIVAATGKKPSQIATLANVSDTTLTRLLNNPEYSGTLSQITVDRIAQAFNIPGPAEMRAAGVGKPMLLGFSEAERIDPSQEKGDLARLVNAAVDGRDGIEPWRMRGLALEAAGYLPGDVLIVDTTAQAKPGDAVCAQVADYQRGAAETVFRIFDPPFLVGAGRERMAYKPLLIDGQRVTVRGVVVNSLRPHRLSASI